MKNFITFGIAHRTTINKQDIVSIKRVSNTTVEINYRNTDYQGKAPYMIEAITVGMSETEYKSIIEELEEDYSSPVNNQL